MKGLFVAFYLFIAVIFTTCQQKQEQKYQPQKIFYINSYHPGYGSSDDIMAGIETILAESGVDWKATFMDSKNHPEEEAINKKVEEIMGIIEDYQPDLIIASDDNAVKFIIEPYFKNDTIPVVFCGVNWSAAQYGLPTRYITGMLEVLPIREMLTEMRKYYPEAKRLTVLSENTTSEQKNKDILDTLYQGMGFAANYALVNNFEEWKTEFLEANNNSDLIFIPTNGAVKNWDEQEAISFIKEHIKVPVLASDDFMMKYAVFGLTKVAAEQGEWAAEVALEILHGSDPAKIPLTKNSQTKAWINQELATIVGFQPDQALQSKAHLIP